MSRVRSLKFLALLISIRTVQNEVISVEEVSELDLHTENFSYFTSGGVSYSLDKHESLFREFTFVSVGNSQDITIAKPLITHSVYIDENNSTTSFFDKLVRIDHYEAPFTTLVLQAACIEEVAGVLDKISKYYEMLSMEKTSEIPHYVFFIVIPSVSAVITKSAIETLILDKMTSNAVSRLVLDSSIFLVFAEKQADLSNEPKVAIWEVYAVKNKPFVNYIGEDKSDLSRSKLVRRQDWEGTQLTCGTYIQTDEMGEVVNVSKPELDLKRDPQGKFQLKSGLSVSIYSDFATALNFTTSVFHPYKEYTNISHFLQTYDSVFDISISHHGVTPERLKQIQPLAPTYSAGIIAYFVQPPIHTFRNIYRAPFAASMWIMIGVTWIVITLAFQLVSYARAAFQVKGYSCEEVEVKEKERDEQMTREAVWWAIAAACQQGWHMTPATTTTRSVFFTGLIFSFLCYAAYTATIVSELWDTVTPIKNLEALLENSQKIFLIDETDVANLIYQGVSQRNSKMLKKIIKIDMNTAFKEVVHTNPGSSCLLDWPEYFVAAGKEMVGNKKGYSTSTDDDDGLSNPEVQFCEHVRSYRYVYLPSIATMFVPRKSPFRKTFNFRIIVGIERGLFGRYWKVYLKNTRIRCLEETNKSYALGIYDTWIVFVILLFGYGLSLSILGMEIIYQPQIQ